MVLKSLVLRPLVREKTRTALTLLGIAVGVAVVVAIQLANQSALRAFRESVDAVAGRANFQIVSEAVPLDEGLLIGLQPLWPQDVRFAPVIDAEGVIEPSQTPVRLLAVDLLSDLHFRDYRYARVVADDATPAVYLELFRHDSVVLPITFAQQHRLVIGDAITLNVNGNRRRMIVRGLLEAQGPAAAFNGSLVICDIAAAQKSFGMVGRLTRIDLQIPEHASSSILAQIGRLLPAGARVERPSRRSERVSSMLRAFRVNLFALAGVALLVGMFLVYNTVLISILRRRRDVGIVKTLGVSPRQIFAAFLGEGLLFGVAGSLLGILLGKALAGAILHMVGRTINALYVTSAPEAVVLTPNVIGAGVAVGVVISLISAFQPALEASRVRPDVMIRPGLQQTTHPAGERKLMVVSAICFVAGAAVSRLPPLGGIAWAGYLAVLLVVIGFSLLAPASVRAAAALARRPLQSVFGLTGRLAAASLPASLRRTAVASAALSVATGMMVAVALMVGSFRETVRIWVTQTIQSDLWLRPSRGLTNAATAVFPAAIGEELEKVDFIAGVDRVRGKDIVYGDSMITVGSGEFDVAGPRGDLPMVAPRSARDALLAARNRNGVLVSESFALKFEKSLGDLVELPTANGIQRFPITGIYRDYSSDRGVVVMDRPVFIRAFRDDTINTVVVFLKKGVDRETARKQLESVFGPKYNAFVMTSASIRREVMTIFDQTFLITYALLAVAVVVAVLGIVNTLSALILERRRELALLRIAGMSRGEVTTMLLLESAILGAVSTVIGLVMGYALSWVLIYVINRQSFGWTIAFHTPAALLTACLAVTFLAATVAGMIPARAANKIDIAAAIKAE